MQAHPLHDIIGICISWSALGKKLTPILAECLMFKRMGRVAGPTAKRKSSAPLLYFVLLESL
jgi:hypothetical protein